MLKKLLIIFVVLGVLYSGAWGYMAYKMGEIITQYYTIDGPAKGIAFYGEAPRISGFPFSPIITYKDGLEKDNVLIYFDTLTLSGFPIPTRSMTLEINGDISLVDKNTDIKIDADRFMVKFIVPKSLPASARKSDIANWQKDVGTLTLLDALFATKTVNIEGAGTFGLDDNLQITTDLKTKTFGYDALISFFVETGDINPFVGALTISGLNALAVDDPLTNKKYVELDIIINKSQIYLGPLTLGRAAQIVWR